jgi:hypothetical protein
MVLRMQREVELRFAPPPQRFHRGISERKTWILTIVTATLSCRNSRVADEAGKVMAYSAVAGQAS